MARRVVAASSNTTQPAHSMTTVCRKREQTGWHSREGVAAAGNGTARGGSVLKHHAACEQHIREDIINELVCSCTTGRCKPCLFAAQLQQYCGPTGDKGAVLSTAIRKKMACSTHSWSC
jgi:hypothetical protein